MRLSPAGDAFKSRDAAAGLPAPSFRSACRKVAAVEGAYLIKEKARAYLYAIR